MGLHQCSCDFEDDRFSVAPPDAVGGSDIGAQVNVLAGHFVDSLPFNEIHKASGRSMKQEIRWRLFIELEINFD